MWRHAGKGVPWCGTHRKAKMTAQRMRKRPWSVTLMLRGGLVVNFGGYQVNTGLVNSTTPLPWISRLISLNLCRNKWRQPGARYGRLCLHNGVFQIYSRFFKTLNLMSCACFDKSSWSRRTLGWGLVFFFFFWHVYRRRLRLSELLGELVEILQWRNCALCVSFIGCDSWVLPDFTPILH